MTTIIKGANNYSSLFNGSHSLQYFLLLGSVQIGLVTEFRCKRAVAQANLVSYQPNEAHQESTIGLQPDS